MQEHSVCVMPVVERLSPAMFVEMPYTPAVLLEAHFDASITTDAEFADACEMGFDAYFEDMYERTADGDEIVFVEQCYTPAQVIQELYANLHDVHRQLIPLAWCAGCRLGWLSALALSQPTEAQVGLEVLEKAVERLGRRVARQALPSLPLVVFSERSSF